MSDEDDLPVIDPTPSYPGVIAAFAKARGGRVHGAPLAEDSEVPGEPLEVQLAQLDAAEAAEAELSVLQADYRALTGQEPP
jgi:hypothetical protein